jgi:hypothetical protein
MLIYGSGLIKLEREKRICGELVTPLLTVIPVGVYFTPY